MTDSRQKSFVAQYFSEERIRGGVWGAGLAAAVLIVGGSYFPGWQLDSSAEAAVLEGQQVVLVKALAPVCAERFRAQVDLPVQADAFKKVSSWSRGPYLVDHDWVIPSGVSPSVDRAVGTACAALLEDLTK